MTMPPQPAHRADIPAELADGLPPDILAILESYGRLLERNGVVECRTERRLRACYRLRFRERDGHGRTRHRSISLGHDPDVANSVRQILSYWRHQREEARRRRREADQERRRERAERRRLQALVLLSTGGGRRHRRRIRQHVDKLVSANDPVSALRLLAMAEQGSTSAPPPGRPRKGKQLW